MEQNASFVHLWVDYYLHLKSGLYNTMRGCAQLQDTVIRLKSLLQNKMNGSSPLRVT